MAGLGETAIKNGGPPVLSRLSGAKVAASRYDVEAAIFKIVYEAASLRAVSMSSKFGAKLDDAASVTSRASRGSETPTITEEARPTSMESQFRCDPDRWASSFEVVVDPPPTSFSVLRRHPLMENGGLWITIEHDIDDTLQSKRVSISIEAKNASTSGRERTSVVLNGSVVRIDREELSPAEVTSLKKQKRSQVTRTPLDQPPLVPLLRRNPSTVPKLNIVDDDEDKHQPEPRKQTAEAAIESPTWTNSITGWFSAAAGSARSIVIPPTAASPGISQPSPLNAAGNALEKMIKIHLDRFSESTTADDQWMVASRNGNAIVEKKALPFVSEDLPVYRSSRIVQGSSAEDISSVLSSDEHRKKWDSAKLLNCKELASFGDGISVKFQTAKMAFPYQNRAFRTINVVARADSSDSASPIPSHTSTGDAALIFHASTSLFDPSSLHIVESMYNPGGLPFGSVVLEGWILETLDPYSHDQFAIPSTRVMHVCAIDFTIPQAMNNIANSALPYRILAVEKLLDPDARLPTIVSPPTAIVLPRHLLKTRKVDKASEFGLLGDVGNSIISLRHPATNVTELVVKVSPMEKTAIQPTTLTPSEQPHEARNNGQGPNQSADHSSHSRTPSTWSRISGNGFRLTSRKVARGLSETTEANEMSTEEPCGAEEPLAEFIIEIPAGTGERFVLTTSLSQDCGAMEPLSSDYQSWPASNPVSIVRAEIGRTPSPVLRGAMTDSQAYLVGFFLKTSDSVDHQDSRATVERASIQSAAHSTKHSRPLADGGVFRLRIEKLPKDGTSETGFTHNGVPVAIIDHHSATAPSGSTSKLESGMKQWPKLKRCVTACHVFDQISRLY